jgi:hypothetical protein
MRLLLQVSLFLCLFISSILKGYCGDSLVTLNTYWRYLDNGTTPPSSWTTLAFVDTAWHVGAGEFGYGDGDETTVISYGPSSGNKYITTYFRHEFQVNNISGYKSLTLHLRRDDGAIVYINGTEVYRSNMPSGAVTNSTLAASSASGSEETSIIEAGVNISTIHNGFNLVSVELHQSSVNGSDASFDLALIADSATELLRGPYLQNATHNSMIACWRTSSMDISKILYGTSLNYSDTITDTVLMAEHSINVTGLHPYTKYYYAICSSDGILQGDTANYFFTTPDSNTNERIRIWAMGDFGNGAPEQQETRQAYYNYTDSVYTNIFLMLGDNAYTVGSDEDYTVHIFKNNYEDILKKSVVYSTCGNHELLTSTDFNQTGPYYDIFSFPKNGEAGGLPSGNEAYYSFNYGNIHFVCLESNVDSFGQANLSNMLTWLDSDLAVNNKKWTIAYFHFPPLSKGYHDSDHNMTEIWCRQNINPVLEKYNVDLVLGGHSHDYERSHLLKGHFGLSTTLADSMIIDSTGGVPPNYYNKTTVQDSGTVYAVVGSSSEITPLQPDWPHPAMYYSSADLFGSMVIDIKSDTMDVVFLTNHDSIADHFGIIKSASAPPVVTSEIRRGPYLQISAPTEIYVRWATSNHEPSRLLFGTSVNYSDSIIDTARVAEHTTWLQGLSPYTKYYYAIRLLNDSLVGDSTYYFYTAPVSGSTVPVRIWTMGDFGTGDQRMDSVRDSYFNYTGSDYTNLMLWLGNNAYPGGSKADYENNVFPHFASVLKNTCVYTATGDKEWNHANSVSGTGDYFDIFNLPKFGEAGGLASNKEAYYSFDYANIHFVVLESQIDSFGLNNVSAMSNWLNADLFASTQKWKIVLIHNPPYSKGTFDSDVEDNMISVRTILIPILETRKIDLVLSAHSHKYERSFLIKGHTGPSSTFNVSTMGIDTTSGTPPAFYDKSAATSVGEVYAVIGSIDDSQPVRPDWPHPVMSAYEGGASGSMVLNINGDTLDAVYLTSDGTVADHFGILKYTQVSIPESMKTDELKLYPDPVHSFITVEIPMNSNPDISFKVYNAIGEQVKVKISGASNHIRIIDARGLKSGIYFLRMTGRNVNTIKQFVKE